MTVKQGLKRKNKIVSELNSLYSKINEYNSMEESAPRRYSVEELIEKTDKLTEELIELKTKIHRANTPVYDKIFRLSELKSRAKKLSMMDVEEGVSTNRWSDSSVKKVVEINVVERDNMVKELEEEIDTLQDELDVWNVETEI